MRNRKLNTVLAWWRESPQEEVPTHVDVVKNEWLAGYQVVVARVWAESGDVRIDAPSPWDEFVARYRDDAAEPLHFLETLHERMHGDYVFATEPHSPSDCPFEAMVVPLQQAEPQPHAQHA